MKKLAVFLLLFSSAAWPGDRIYVNNCPTFVTLDANTQAMLVQAYLSGLWAGSEAGSKAEVMTAVLLDDRTSDTAMWFSGQATRLCHAKLAVDGEGDTYDVMTELVVDLIREAEAQ